MTASYCFKFLFLFGVCTSAMLRELLSISLIFLNSFLSTLQFSLVYFVLFLFVAFSFKVTSLVLTDHSLRSQESSPDFLNAQTHALAL